MREFVTGATAHAPHSAGEAERKGRKRSTVERVAVEGKGCGTGVGIVSIFPLLLHSQRYAPSSVGCVATAEK